MCREKCPIYKRATIDAKKQKKTQKNDESDYCNPFVVDTVKKVCTVTIPNDSL